MKTALGILIGGACWVLVFSCSASSTTVFQDGFESGSLGTWIVSSSNDGRVSVRSDFSPFAGQFALVLDDSVSDAIYSVAEATLQLDLSNKKNVVLEFEAKSLGNEPDPPPTGNFVGIRNFDGVSISTDGGTTWRTVQSLAYLGTDWTSFSIPLDDAVAALGGTFGAGIRIRFSEYDNAPAPLDGISIDDVRVTAEDDQRAVLELPAQAVEGSGPYTGYVLLAFAPLTPITLTLTASPADQLIMPTNVVVPAGQTYASFSFSVADDNLVNLTRTVNVHLTAAGVSSTSSSITILDNDVPTATLTVPSRLTEGTYPTANASLRLDRPPAVNLTANLSASPPGQIYFPSSVVIPAGQTQAVFTVQAVDDIRIDGNIPVTLTASNSSMAPVTAQTIAVDNEQRILYLSLPVAVQEAMTATGIVSIPGTLPTPLAVKLTSANEAELTVPAEVTIPAGQTQASFLITALDNSARDGSRTVNIVASATTFTTATSAITIHDNEVAGYVFGALSNIVNVSQPVAVTVSAADVDGNPIAGYSGEVNLRVVLPDGNTLPVTPSTANLSGAEWSGTIQLPVVNTAPLRLRATDTNANSGDSSSFDIMRTIDLPAADLVWDPTRGQLYASVPASAGGTNANEVVAIDPASAQISGSVVTGQDPGKLALTSGGEYLYTALNANGTVDRINPATMSVGMNFPVGVSPYYGTLYVQDMCTVAGQPDLLVVSQKRLSVTPANNGVAVYDNGVARTNKTSDLSDEIEPSADPTVFFAYNTESTGYDFRKLRLDASGISQIVADGTLLGGFSVGIRSDGDKVFSTSGVELDGAQMRRLGTFPVSGPVCPDLANNRVYFLELQSSYYPYSPTSDRIDAFDPTSFSTIRQLTLSTPVASPKSFIRWGTNGLAFLTDSNVVLINSSRLVPSGPPADLTVAVKALPNPATVAVPLTYTVTVSNQGPNVARNTILVATLSDDQVLQDMAGDPGTPVVSSNTVTLVTGDLNAGASATLTLSMLPQSAGTLTCAASVISDTLDPDFTDNTAAKVVGVGFQPGINTVNRLRLAANNLIYDPTRNLLWATIPDTVPGPLGRSIVSINPTNGLISDPLPINGTPRAQCMALSANGRYLYVGLSDAPEMLRVDLDSGPTSIRIPLGLNQWNNAAYAEDVEPLDGDGTSFLVTTYGDDGAAVFDGSVRRPHRSGIYTVDRIARTSTPGVFFGYDNSDTSFALSSLVVDAAGVSISHSTWSSIGGFYGDISGAGNLVLFSTGDLVDSTNLSLKADFGISGRPCLDFPNQRAYILNGTNLYAFNTATLLPAATFRLPVSVASDSAQDCVRWALDGFAILGQQNIYVFRWSATIPPEADANTDGFSDAWEATYFDKLNVNPAGDEDGDGLLNFEEYLFATSPIQVSQNPMQVSSAYVGDQPVLRLVFPRRVGLQPEPYNFVTSSDLKNWVTAQNVSETVLSTQTLNGVQVETVEALIPMTNSSCGFVRLHWNPQ